MTNCGVCTATTDGFICAECGDKLAAAIGDMPALLADLEISATKQDRIAAGGKRGKGDEAPMPFNWNAADQLWACWNTLTTWARHLAESRQVALPAVTTPRPAGLRIFRNRMYRTVEHRALPPVLPLVSWLLGAVQSIRMDEAGAAIFDEIIYAHAAAERAIDRPDPDIYAGRCDAPDVRVRAEDGQLRTTVGTCGADMYARLADREVKCTSCGVEYDLAERKQWLLGKIPDVLATNLAISNALTTLLSPVTPSMIRQMAFRGQIVDRGTDELGHKLFRVGDVMDVLESRARKVSERRSRLAS